MVKQSYGYLIVACSNMYDTSSIVHSSDIQRHQVSNCWLNIFSFSILAQGQHAHVKLVRNGNMIARVTVSSWDQSSETVVLQLNKGDDIAVRNDDITAINFHGDLYSSFSGFLLYDYSDGAPIVGK